MNPGDTIIAPASGPARSLRAILRLSGPHLPELLLDEALLVDPVALADCSKPSIRRVVLRMPLPLPALVILSPGRASYTGDHAAEFLLPGNPALVQRVMDLFLSRPGVRLATPGEFSARAFLSGRLTLAQAEGIAATIAARTDEELAAAASLLGGDTGRAYTAWAEELGSLLALVEAGIDFTDQEDVVPITPDALALRLGVLAHALGDHLGARRGAEHRDILPTIALAGPPNAGKSTLFNALLGRARAVVSPLAGTTRDVLAERLDLAHEVPGADPVMLLDLAGLDDAPRNALEREAQSSARAALASADVIVQCDSAGRFDTPVPGPPTRPIIRVRTKSDLPAISLPGSPSLPVCALDGTNLGTLRRAIADAAWAVEGHGGAATLLPRHRRALTQTLDHLDAAIGHVRPRRHEPSLGSPELVAGALRSALDALGELTGRVTPDDVIGRVFATFCVGK